MNKLANAVAAIALVGTPVFAADMPVKAPPPAPAPVYGWTGLYVGGNVGYGWGKADTDVVGNATTVVFPTFLGGFPNNSVAVAGSNTAKLNGASGGGQIGYNYQFSPRWVLGFEADIQDSGERGGNTFAQPFSTPVCTLAAAGPPGVPVVFPNNGPPTCLLTGTLNGTAATTYDAKINWFGTVRGRVGGLITDQVLIYGTGGLAFGRVEVSGITGVSGSINTNAALTPSANAFSDSRTKVGFTVGGGVEGKISYGMGWTWKLEYLYVDLGSLDTIGPFPGASVNPPGLGLITSPFSGTITTHTHFTDNILRVGLNYQFH
ncbi:outer membrane protein [Bradyrhizobium septentrionale]|uniref:Outer membrane beta-barrel protein n=2 Tax=Bradyrhizobium septentrionale TaxID=1404411 RepID=A0ABZ2P927_9BRAD